MMKSRRTLSLAVLLLLAAGLLYLWKKGNSAQDVDGWSNHAETLPRGAESEHRKVSNRSNETPIPSATSPDSADAAQPSTDEILEKIHDASVTYDPKELPKIQPFLTHESPEIRKAAVDGMVILGDASAGAMIREAAKSAPTPQEAVQMLEAADYVELPSARAIIRKKNAQE